MAVQVGIVILTQGDRVDSLRAVLQAAAAMPFDERVVVLNGVDLDAPPGWRTVVSPENLGVPGGRALGLRAAAADVVVFVDDDSGFPDDSAAFVEGIRQSFEAQPDLGALALRVVVEGTDAGLRRWMPTTRDAQAPVDAPTFPGNGHALRRAAFEDVGGYLEPLFFKHEETELAWRLIDRGWRIGYDPRLAVEHPATTESRHRDAFRVGLRNKIWIARLRLPMALVPVAVLVTVLRHMGRVRTRDQLAAFVAGARAGGADLPEERDPISWRTVAKLTRLGRPPVL